MSWDYERYHWSVTGWLVETLDEQRIKYSVFLREAGFTAGSDGRILRSAKTIEKPRNWKVIDICKIANYLNEHPSHILAKAEVYYKINRNIPLKKIQELVRKKIESSEKKAMSSSSSSRKSNNKR